MQTHTHIIPCQTVALFALLKRAAGTDCAGQKCKVRVAFPTFLQTTLLKADLKKIQSFYALKSVLRNYRVLWAFWNIFLFDQMRVGNILTGFYKGGAGTNLTLGVFNVTQTDFVFANQKKSPTSTCHNVSGDVDVGISLSLSLTHTHTHTHALTNLKRTHLIHLNAPDRRAYWLLETRGNVAETTTHCAFQIICYCLIVWNSNRSALCWLDRLMRVTPVPYFVQYFLASTFRLCYL